MDKEKTFLQHGWQKALVIFGIMTFIALLFIVQNGYVVYFSDKEVDHLSNLVYFTTYFYILGILIPVIVWLSHRYRIERNNWKKNLTIHLAAAIILAFIHRGVSFTLYLLLYHAEKLFNNTPKGLSGKIIYGTFDSFVLYWVILGIYYSYDYYQQYKHHRVISAQLETQLAQAQLQALKIQLQPHFLFNTLHSVSSLMEEDINAARRMLVRLSDLLRQTLDSVGIQEVTLNEELEFLKNYLEIELIRFQDRLKVNYKINSDILDTLIPNLILQPIVENAIRHGIAPKAEGGEITISAFKNENHINILVEDDGIGSDNDKIKNNKNGVGISNTIKRLNQLYGEQYSFKIEKSSGGGTIVSLSIPLKNNSDKI